LDQTDIPAAAKETARTKLMSAAKKSGVGQSSENSDNEGGNEMEEELKKELTAVKAELEALKAEKATAAEQSASLTQTIADKDAEITRVNEEKASLVEENANLKLAALTEVRTQRMVAAGFPLEANAEKAEKKKAVWASFSDDQFDTYLADLVAAKPKKETQKAEASMTDLQMPRLSVVEGTEYSSLKNAMRELARPHSAE